MRISDYWDLSKKNIKTRKGSSRNTVAGIAFALSVLIPVIFLTLSLNLGIAAEINSVRTIASFKVVTKNAGDDSAGDIAARDADGFLVKRGLPSNAVGKSIAESGYAEESLVYEAYKLNFEGKSIRVGIEGQPDKTLVRASEDNALANKFNNIIKVSHLDRSGGRFFSTAEAHDLKSDTILTGGEGFSQPEGLRFGQKQVLISEQFLSLHYPYLDSQSVIGKKFSLKVMTDIKNSYMHGEDIRWDNDTVSTNAYTGLEESQYYEYSLIGDFFIAGVVNKDYYGLVSNEHEGHIWIAGSSVYYEDNGSTASLHPKINRAEVYTEFGARTTLVATYISTSISMLEYESVRRGVILPLAGSIEYYPDCELYNFAGALPYRTETVQFQAADFTAAAQLSKIISEKLKPVYLTYNTYDFDSMFKNEAYININILYDIASIISNIMFAFSGAVLIITLLGLYYSINYSVASRRGFMGMLRAVGMKRRDLPKLYLFEMLRLFALSFVFAFAASFSLSFAAKLLFDNALHSIAAALGLVIKLNFTLYFVVLAIAAGFSLIVSAVFSFLACRRVIKPEILEVMSDEA